MSILIKGMDMPKDCGDCPFCTFTADEKRYIGYCNTSDDDYYCKALDRFMEYDEVDGGVDILGKPKDCPLIEVPTPHGRLTNADETKEFLRRLFCPTEEEAAQHRAILQELDTTIKITPTENGFIAEVKGLNMRNIYRNEVHKYRSKYTQIEVYAVFYNGYNFPTVQNWAARSSFAWPQWVHDYGTQRLELYEGSLQEAMEIHVGEYVIRYDKIFSLLSDRAFEEVFELMEDSNG